VQTSKQIKTSPSAGKAPSNSKIRRPSRPSKKLRKKKRTILMTPLTNLPATMIQGMKALSKSHPSEKPITSTLNSAAARRTSPKHQLALTNKIVSGLKRSSTRGNLNQSNQKTTSAGVTVMFQPHLRNPRTTLAISTGHCRTP